MSEIRNEFFCVVNVRCSVRSRTGVRYGLHRQRAMDSRGDETVTLSVGAHQRVDSSRLQRRTRTARAVVSALRARGGLHRLGNGVSSGRGRTAGDEPRGSIGTG